ESERTGQDCARSPGWRYRLWWCSPPSRCTCSSTRPSSGTSGGYRSPPSPSAVWYSGWPPGSASSSRTARPAGPPGTTEPGRVLTRSPKGYRRPGWRSPCPLLVYGAGLGLPGSAVANATAQTLSGALFVRALVAERVPLRPHPRLLRAQLVVGRDLVLRGAAFQACFLSATAVAGRFGGAALGAHQIAFQLWSFCALVLDAVAIAAQSLVGAALGAADATAARALARRIARVGLLCGAAFAVVILAGAGVLPRL